SMVERCSFLPKVSAIPYTTVPDEEADVLTRLSSVWSGIVGIVKVTSIRPRILRWANELKFVRFAPFIVPPPGVYEDAFGLISNRLFPEKFRYLRLRFQFQFQSYGQLETLYFNELLPTSKIASLLTLHSSAG